MTTHRTNDVTLFSNGIGHFRRSYKIDGGKEANFSIPFKRDHIGDVAASLQVFGKVRLTKPPSFTPSNANATSLRIEQSDAYRSLLRSLSGAQVTVEFTDNKKSQYTLLGIDQQEVSYPDRTIFHDFVVLMQNGKVYRRAVIDVKDLHFDDEGVRTEIDKALKNNFQTIKPDSTLLDLSLQSVGDSDTDAVVQYTIPVAAWKMRYAIRQEGDSFTLEGAAIIDNNTDEDWDNFRVSVVTGNPISFSTDIANVVVPQRKFVRLVDTTALGNVDVADGYPSDDGYSLQQLASGDACLESYHPVAAAARGVSKGMRSRSMGPKMSTANICQFGMSAGGPESLQMDAAEVAGVDSKEVGDFCVFTSKEPITILARKSAVVPMFTVPLTKAGVVLLYKESNHSRRPYRTVKFKNETEFSLGKGKTVIYNSGVFSGECVLEATKPTENRMLPHCLENGVKIVKEQKPVETKRTALRISEGVGVTEDVYTAVTSYEIENKKNETFKVAVEHVKALGAVPTVNVDFDLSGGAKLAEQEKLSDGTGYRLYFEVAPNQKLTLTATETKLNSQSVYIGSYFPWLTQNIISVNNPLSQDKQVLAAIKVQEQIDEAVAKVNETNSRRNELVAQGERVQKMLGSAKDVGNKKTVDNWVADLDATEQAIRTLDNETLPQLNKAVKDLNDKLKKELGKITANWKA